MDERKTVKVACMIPNGVMIRLWKQGYDDGTGFHPMVGDGPGVHLAGPGALNTGVASSDQSPGITSVDAEWWSKWLRQHEADSMVIDGYIFELKDEQPPSGTESEAA